MHTCDHNACPEYNELTRRSFLAATAGGAAAFVAAHSWMPRVALAADHRGSQRDVVIQIYLRGGADGMTMVPPYAEPRYHQMRPTLAVPAPGMGAGAAIDLDGFFGLSPALAPLLPAYNNDHLLIVHASGSTDPSRSHFEAQWFMEVGRPRAPLLLTGWLGRHLASVAPMSPNPLIRAIGIGSGLQQTIYGSPLALPIPDLDEFGLAGPGGTAAARHSALGTMYQLVGDPVRAAALNTLATIDLLNTINFAGYTPAGGAVYPDEPFAHALKQTAALIKAQVGVEAIAIDLQGWDTHANQGSALGGLIGNLMTTLANGLSAFYADMTSGANHPFTAVVLTEFGRRLAENGNQGTDHGHGNVMFVLGQCVAGGRVMANWPGMQPEQLFEGQDLEVTIDYRDILAELVQQRLGNPALGEVFPGFTPTPRGVFAC